LNVRHNSFLAYAILKNKSNAGDAAIRQKKKVDPISMRACRKRFPAPILPLRLSVSNTLWLLMAISLVRQQNARVGLACCSIFFFFVREPPARQLSLSERLYVSTNLFPNAFYLSRFIWTIGKKSSKQGRSAKQKKKRHA
jgi:hypothetical protein